MSRFAERTTVSAERSRTEIEQLLRRYGASAFGFATEGRRAVVQFKVRALLVRMTLETPNPGDFHRTPVAGRVRSDASAVKAWEDECRRLWRSLALLVKAKLEAVASGISTLEREFLADVVLADGRTVGEHALPALARAAENGGPLLLPPIPEA